MMSRMADIRIAQQVTSRLGRDLRIGQGAVNVRVSNGQVTLSGTVPNREAWRRAHNIAARSSGVRTVQNRLGVRKPMGAVM